MSEVLLESLEASPWQEGIRLATERELEDHFCVSRTVVRGALDLLEGDGVIVRRRGAGAFVGPQREPTPVFGLIEALGARGDQIDVSVFRVGEESPDAPVSAFLQLDSERSRVCHVTALLRESGRPLCLINSRIPASRLPGILESVQEVERGAKPRLGSLTLTRAEVLVEHTFFGGWGGPKLGAGAGDPALMARLIQFGTTPRARREQPLEFARIFFSARSTQVAFTSKSRWTAPSTPSA